MNRCQSGLLGGLCADGCGVGSLQAERSWLGPVHPLRVSAPSAVFEMLSNWMVQMHVCLNNINVSSICYNSYCVRRGWSLRDLRWMSFTQEWVLTVPSSSLTGHWCTWWSSHHQTAVTMLHFKQLLSESGLLFIRGGIQLASFSVLN